MKRIEAIKILSREKECVLQEIEKTGENNGYVSPDGLIRASDYVEACSVAIEALLEREDKKNEPLTPDELRQMGGEPYWHVSLQGNGSYWAILDPCYARCVEDYHYGEYWLAYRHKKEDD